MLHVWHIPYYLSTELLLSIRLPDNWVVRVQEWVGALSWAALLWKSGLLREQSLFLRVQFDEFWQMYSHVTTITVKIENISIAQKGPLWPFTVNPRSLSPASGSPWSVTVPIVLPFLECYVVESKSICHVSGMFHLALILLRLIHVCVCVSSFLFIAS